MSYRTVELIAACGFLLVSAFAWISSRDLPPDARMFPSILLVILSVSALVMIVRSLSGASQRAIGDEIDSWSFTTHTPPMLGGFAVFAGYLALVEPLGFFTASALFIVALSMLAKYRRWWVTIISAAAFCAFVYVIFVLVFERPLPEEFFMSFEALSALGEVVRA